jgi:MOSC domain-containing protein YiiM
MWEGSVAGIYIADSGGEPMRSLAEVRAIAGSGLEGDRYATRAGTYSSKPAPGREVTLIESEAVQAAEHEYGVRIDPGAARRNIVTSGVALNHLVGKEFRVGEVTLKGIRLCEPCAHLANLTQKGALKALIHRGGLRAEIVTEGTIRVGDEIQESPVS